MCLTKSLGTGASKKNIYKLTTKLPNSTLHSWIGWKPLMWGKLDKIRDNYDTFWSQNFNDTSVNSAYTHDCIDISNAHTYAAACFKLLSF